MLLQKVFVGLVIFVSGCVSMLFTGTQENKKSETTKSGSWELMFSHDEKGKTLKGSKEKLLEAVRAGKPVRVSFGSGRVEHFTDAKFMVIFKGELFAQIDPIQSQRPMESPHCVTFREPGKMWRTILGTNGQNRPLMDGSEPRERTTGAKWFVQN